MARANVYERSVNAVILNGNIGSGCESVQNALLKVKEEPQHLLDYENHELCSHISHDDCYINQNNDFHSTIVPGQELDTNQLLLNQENSVKFKDVQDHSGIRENNKENEYASQKSNQFVYKGLRISLPKFENKFNRILEDVRKETCKPGNKRKMSPENLPLGKRSQQHKRRKKYFNESTDNYHDDSLVAEKQKIRHSERRMKSTRIIRDVHCNLRSNKKICFPSMKCDICSLEFYANIQLKNHKTHYTKGGDFACNYCNLSFAWQYQLDIHTKSAHFTLPSATSYKFTCDCCKQKFQKKTALQAHLLHFHDWDESEVKSTDSKKSTNKGMYENKCPIRSFNEFKQVYKKKDDLPNLIDLLNMPIKEISKHPLIPNKVQDNTALTVEKQYPDKDQDQIQTTSNAKCIKEKTVPYASFSEKQQTMKDKVQDTNQLDTFESSLIYEEYEVLEMSCDTTEKVEEEQKETTLGNLPNNQEIITNTKVSFPHQQNNENSWSDTLINSCESLDEDVSVYVETIYQDNDRTEDNGDLEKETKFYFENKYELNDPTSISNYDERCDHISDISIVTEFEAQKFVECSNKDQNAVVSKDQTDCGEGNLNVFMSLLKSDDNLQLNSKNKLSETPSDEDILSERGDSSYKCKDVSIHLIRVDEFLNVYTPSLVSCKKEKAENHTSIESDTLRTLSLELLSDNLLKSQSEEMENLNQIKLKEINIPLIRLENMDDAVEQEEDTPRNMTNIKRDVLHENELFSCNVCDEVFSSKEERKKHVKLVHTAYLSSICNARFTRKQTLLYHYLYRHTVLGFNKCCVCRKTYTHQTSLKRHLSLHCIEIIEPNQNHSSTDSKIQCTSIKNKHKCLPACGRQFWLLTSLKVHQNKCRLWKSQILNSQNDNVHVSDITDDHVQSGSVSEIRNLENRSFAQRRHLKHNLFIRGTSLKHRSRSNFQQANKVPINKHKKDNNLPYVYGKSVNLKDYYVNPKHSVVNIKTKGKSSRYPCEICNTQFRSLKNLEIHKQLYLQPLTVLCHICGFMFPTKMILIFHIRATHGVFRQHKLQCGVCGQGFKRNEYLRIHMMHFHNNPIISKVQSTLNKYFTPKEEPHAASPIDKEVESREKYSYPPLRCKVCNLTFDNYSTFMSHRIYYSQRGTFRCSWCVEQFNGKYMFDHHRKTVHNSTENYDYTCSTCNEGFTSNSELLSHTMHFRKKDSSHSLAISNNDDILKKGAMMKLHICTICDMDFSTAAKLLMHQVEYSNYGDFPCDKCEKKCRTVLLLEEHQRLSHSKNADEQKYRCNICEEVLTSESTLTAHSKHFHGAFCDRSFDNTNDESKIDVTGPTNSNRGLGSLRCHTCGQEFEKELSLKNHMMEYSNDGEYACNTCKRRFFSLSCLEHHKSKHARSGAASCYKFQCPVCSEGFMTPTSLHAHGMHLHGFKFVENIFASRSGRIGKAKVQQDTVCKNSSWSDSKSLDDRPLDELSGRFEVKSTQEKMEPYYSSMLQNVNLKSMIAETCRVEEIVKSDVSEERTFEASTRTERELYTCDDCGFSFDSKSTLLKHIVRYLNEGNYQCEICHRKFMWFTLYEDHQRKHLNRRVSSRLKFKCTICNEKFRDASSAHAHIKHFHNSSGKKCDDERRKEMSLENSPFGPASSDSNGAAAAADSSSEHLDELDLRSVESNGQTEDPNEIDVSMDKSVENITVENVSEPTLNDSSEQPLEMDLHHAETLTLVSNASNNSDHSSTQHGDFCEIVKKEVTSEIVESLVQSEFPDITCSEQTISSCFRQLKTYPSMSERRTRLTLNNSSKLTTISISEDGNLIKNGNTTREELDTSVSKIHEEHGYVRKTFDCNACKQVFATSNELSEHMLSCFTVTSIPLEQNFNSNNDNSWFYIVLSDTTEQPMRVFEIDSNYGDGVKAISANTESSTIQEIQDDDVVIVENETNRPDVEITGNIIDGSKQTIPSRSRDQVVKTTAATVRRNTVNLDTQKVGKLKVKPFAKIIENLTMESIAKYNDNTNDSSNCNLRPHAATGTTNNVQRATNYALNTSTPQNEELKVALYVSQLGRYNLSRIMQLPTVSKSSSTTLATMSANANQSGTTNALKIQGGTNQTQIIPGSYLLSEPARPAEIVQALRSPVSLSKPSLSLRSSSFPTATRTTSTSSSLSSYFAKREEIKLNLVKSNQLSVSKSATNGPADQSIDYSSSSSSLKSVENASKTKTANTTMNVELIYKCRVCSKLFPHKIELTKHMSTCKDLQCTVCGLKFVNEVDLEIHLLEHDSVSCQTCNKEFLSEDAFNGHLSDHKDASKNYCNVCKKTVPFGTKMEDHLLCHSSSKQIKCGLCMHEFCTVSEVADHFKFVHCNYKCSLCSKRCSKRQALEVHMIGNHNFSKDEMCVCKTCDTGFRNEADLGDHLCDSTEKMSSNCESTCEER